MKSLAGVVLLLSVATAAKWSPFPQWFEEPTVLQTKEIDIASRITGGQTAEGPIPYQAGLKIPVGDKMAFCGGTLISGEFILTAAHCCEVATANVEVILGVDEIFNTSDPNRVTMYVPLGSDNIIIHNDWSRLTLKNDICLLRLPDPVELTDYINVAVLPADDSDKYEEKTVIASGWGRTSDLSTSVSPDLNFVELNVITNFKCNLRYFGVIWANHICTDGAGGKSTCNGDSGGPLVLRNSEDNSSTIVGITSFGISFGCQIGWPAVFTRVSKYIGWIQGNMGTNN